MSWTVETLNEVVDQELSSLPEDMKARFVKIAELIAEHGLENVGRPYVKHLEGDLWEIRMKGKDGVSRALYVTARPKRVIVVRVFRCENPKDTPERNQISLKASKGG